MLTWWKDYYMRTKKIFVTGAMGFIGLHWCKKLLSEGHKVYGLDIKNHNTEIKKNKNFFFFQGIRIQL